MVEVQLVEPRKTTSATGLIGVNEVIMNVVDMQYLIWHWTAIVLNKFITREDEL